MKIPPLNLLPPNRRETLKSEASFANAKRSLISLGVLLVIALAVLYGTRIVLDMRLQQQRAEVQNIQNESIQQQGGLLEVKIRQLNARLARVKTIQSGYTQWSPILTDLLSATPRGITLHSLSIDSGNQTLTLKGRAATRSDLLDLEQVLSTSSFFQNPSSPVANLLERENIDFDMTAQLKLPR